MSKQNDDIPSIADVIERAKQRIRDLDAGKAEEPEGFASGDMKKYLENPEKYEKEEGDD